MESTLDIIRNLFKDEKVILTLGLVLHLGNMHDDVEGAESALETLCGDGTIVKKYVPRSYSGAGIGEYDSAEAIPGEIYDMSRDVNVQTDTLEIDEIYRLPSK
ncbi:hypothetical protein GOV11_03760 [Candidatus Woesearchaeota archaeon]|nr:hypothetical protein [Candidatus Woesearchaeota archaeon]